MCDYVVLYRVSFYVIFTSLAGAVAKYCNERVGLCACLCLSVCVCLGLSVREHISRTTRAIFTKFLCMLFIAVARSSSGGVTKSKGNGAILGFSSPLTMHGVGRIAV